MDRKKIVVVAIVAILFMSGGFGLKNVANHAEEEELLVSIDVKQTNNCSTFLDSFEVGVLLYTHLYSI